VSFCHQIASVVRLLAFQSVMFLFSVLRRPSSTQILLTYYLMEDGKLSLLCCLPSINDCCWSYCVLWGYNRPLHL